MSDEEGAQSGLSHEGAATLRALVIRVADAPSAENDAAVRRALPNATLFVKLVGMTEPARPGERYLVREGSGVQMRYARLPNGMQMVLVSAAAPRRVAADEVVATMTGRELLAMVIKMPPEAQGVLLAAEDERDSWTTIRREELASLAAEAR